MAVVVTLVVALVAGPMYDGLYDLLADEDVDVVVRADHPTLNREVAARVTDGQRIDVLSTHSKYAPSQAAWLRPLDGLVGPAVLTALAPKAVDLCRFAGDLLCVPRNIDVRTLWFRTDRMDRAPDSWDELQASRTVFGFSGRESGLFGTFFELVVGAGGDLFADDGSPTMVSDVAVSAVEYLVELARRAPADLADWHYDQVDDALFAGRVDAAALWPGAYGPLRASPHAALLDVAPYPAGVKRRVSYAGCHAWGIPTTAGDVEGAARLIERLCSKDAATLVGGRRRLSLRPRRSIRRG